jgi:aminopeptidase
MGDVNEPAKGIDPIMLDRLAEVAVKVGLDLQPGQDLVLQAPVEALPLVRRITAEAYKAGAGLVTPVLTDEAITLSRYRHAHDESFDRDAPWLSEGLARAVDEGAASLMIYAEDPSLLAGEDPDQVGRAEQAHSVAWRPFLDRITGFNTNWTVISYPTIGWARRLWPEMPDAEAVERLASAIFAASRLDTGDPIAAWQARSAELRARSEWLNAQGFEALHFSGPGTDLRVGLAEGHRWLAAAGRAKNGVRCLPNIPTEEIFTMPHAARVDGHVMATKPLSHTGTLIEGIRMRFEGGRIVEAHADRGQEVLLKVLDTDEGARRLGEVALVPHSSPISQSGLLFLNTLFDENAASHIAVGQCYPVCITGSDELTPEEMEARGANSSNIHIDWMIGSAQVDVDGVRPDGSRGPVMRKGEWAD